MSPRFLAFELAGLGQAPDPDAALAYGHVLAELGGATIPTDARPRITQRADGSDHYRVEISANFT
ncbi:hypothetical protein AB0F24_17285 [Streptomyces platensis]|uniref:hypothetical protein n=1 Tax=Streptomyces platensis TaxID=58346 RepID=UPI0033CF4122